MFDDAQHDIDDMAQTLHDLPIGGQLAVVAGAVGLALSAALLGVQASKNVVQGVRAQRGRSRLTWRQGKP